MANRLTSLLAVAALLAMSGCFIVDEAHRDDVLNGGGSDGGMDGAVDAGPDVDGGSDNILNPNCGEDAANYFVIRDTMENIQLDTTGMANSVRSRCGNGSTGPNGFLALEATAGQSWHFHIQALAGDLDPLIYLLDNSCDARDCDFNADYCAGSASDEHFAFIAPTDGIYYLGIDDGTNQNGGQYTLSAYLLQCGDGTDIHGEACDGSGNCNRDCQAELGDATVSAEVEVNDSQVEANHIVLPASNTFEFSGTLTPDGCTYPDVFSFDINDDNTEVSVTVLDSSGIPCNASSLTEDYTLTIRNAQNAEVIAPMNAAGTGCAIIEPRALPAGVYFLWVENTDALERPVSYNLRLTLN